MGLCIPSSPGYYEPIGSVVLSVLLRCVQRAGTDVLTQHPSTLYPWTLDPWIYWYSR